MTRSSVLAVAGALVLAPSLALAQGGQPMVSALRGHFNFVAGNVLKAAEKMPDAEFAFAHQPR